MFVHHVKELNTPAFQPISWNLTVLDAFLKFYFHAVLIKALVLVVKALRGTSNCWSKKLVVPTKNWNKKQSRNYFCKYLFHQQKTNWILVVSTRKFC
jgi:hypothetical protein